MTTFLNGVEHRNKSNYKTLWTEKRRCGQHYYILAILAVKYNDQFFEAISIFGVSTLVYFSTCIAVIHSRRSQKIKNVI